MTKVGDRSDRPRIRYGSVTFGEGMAAVPWNPKIPPEVRTVHLGQYTPEHAALIGEQLDAVGIAWWTKEPGGINRIWQLGAEIFVDRERLDEAAAIAASIASS